MNDVLELIASGGMLAFISFLLEGIPNWHTLNARVKLIIITFTVIVLTTGAYLFVSGFEGWKEFLLNVVVKCMYSWTATFGFHQMFKDEKPAVS